MYYSIKYVYAYYIIIEEQDFYFGFMAKSIFIHTKIEFILLFSEKQAIHEQRQEIQEFYFSLPKT